MSVVRHLMRQRVQTAEQVAAALQMRLEDAYAELVRAECLGLVRVNVEHEGSGKRRCSWEFAHDLLEAA